VAVVVVLAIIRRASTEALPPLRIQRTLARYVRLPGSSPMLAWPREGEAALQVEGIGGALTAGGSTPVPIASVAKVMTAYLTLREHPLASGQEGFTITITPAEVAEQRQRVALGESTVAVRAGERLSERQALQALLLPSANNVAALLAAYDAGSVARFVARMNATARALGMRSTTYTDPSGFNRETVSTAADQLELARVAMRLPSFAAIVAEPAAELPVVGRVANYDELVGSDGYVGVKTGSDRAAGGCLVFAKRVTVSGHRVLILGVVLGQREGPLIEAALVSARRLGDSAASALRVETVVPARTRVLTAVGADGRHATARTAGALRAIGWGGLALNVRLRVRSLGKHLQAGERVASLSARGTIPAAASVVAIETLAGPSLGWRLEHLF
jgi:serine-type D-Ala-D-Ala carboxypeptidase (penicillin-binding protein 5/6)